MSRSYIVFAFLVGFLIFIAYQLFLILSPFIQPLFWAMIVAFAVYPVYTRAKALLGSESRAAIATSLLTLLAVAPLLAFVLISLTSESIRLYQWLLVFVQEGRLADLADRLQSWGPIKEAEALLGRWDILEERYHQWLENSLFTAGRMAQEWAAGAARGLLVAPFRFFLTFFLLFFFLRDGEKVYRFAYEAVPMDEADKKDVFDKVIGTFEAVIRGQILTAIAQALLAGLVFFALGLPLPILFAALTFISALVPLVGASLIWGPLVLYLFLKAAYVKAVILLVLGIFLISMVDNFLKPILIGEKTKLPYSLLFLGILGGMHVYGLMGIFLAPTILTLFFVLIRIYKQRFL